tara:strand:- start:1326 stop:2258 length:933 start_codon:yes stop_codon:yes gene_type:complete
MNRTLKRPMFRIGGSAGTGITSGLDQPRKQYAKGSTDPYDTFEKKIQELKDAFERYKNMGGTLSFDKFKKEFAEENFNTGGRVGYQQGSMPSFQAQGLPGFLTSFGLNLLATPPQGNIFQTAGVAAREPFNQLQVSQARANQIRGERDFLRGEREAGDEAAMERLKLKLESDERLAGMKTNDALYNVMLEQYIEDDLPPQVAERAALFSTQNADALRTAVTGNKYGGVLTFDIRDPANQKQVRKNLDGKVVYDPYEDNYKYIVVRDGEVFFDEFNSIEEIKFPEINLTEQKKITPPADVFSPNVDDISGA